jgi:hypothetical protein
VKVERRKLTRAELRAMDTTPGLLSRCIEPDGRARLEQLTAEKSPGARIFDLKLTENKKAGEGRGDAG